MAPKVVTKTCPHCGAPLDLKPGVADTPCQYCGHVIHVEWTRKRPPPERIPPDTVYAAPPVARWVIWTIVLGGVVPVLIPIFLTAAPAVSELAAKAGVQTVTLPATCGVNQTLTLDGLTYAGDGTLIVAEVNCKLSIKNSKLSGDVVVLAKNLVEITVENSTLEGKEAAIQSNMNSKVFTKKNTLLRGEEAAVRAELNTELDFEDTTVEAAEDAIRAGTNLTLRATRSTVRGGEHGISAGSNFKVTGKELTVRGKRAALEGDSNFHAELRSSDIAGEEIAVHAGSNHKLTARDETRLFANQTALDADTNLELDLDGSTIEGGDRGIAAAYNAKLNLDGAKVIGRRTAIETNTNLDLSMTNSEIRSNGVAVCSTHNAEIDARNATIVAADAFRFRHKPRTLDLESTTVTGSRIFNATGCRPSRMLDVVAPLAPLALEAPARSSVSPNPKKTATRASDDRTKASGTAARFDAGAARKALDSAVSMASAVCRAEPGKDRRASVSSGFDPDGTNGAARVTNTEAIGAPAAACVEAIFRRVSIPAFDVATKPSALTRIVPLK